MARRAPRHLDAALQGCLVPGDLDDLLRPLGLLGFRHAVHPSWTWLHRSQGNGPLRHAPTTKKGPGSGRTQGPLATCPPRQAGRIVLCSSALPGLHAVATSARTRRLSTRSEDEPLGRDDGLSGRGRGGDDAAWSSAGLVRILASIAASLAIQPTPGRARDSDEAVVSSVTSGGFPPPGDVGRGPAASRLRAHPRGRSGSMDHPPRTKCFASSSLRYREWTLEARWPVGAARWLSTP